MTKNEFLLKVLYNGDIDNFNDCVSIEDFSEDSIRTSKRNLESLRGLTKKEIKMYDNWIEFSNSADYEMSTELSIAIEDLKNSYAQSSNKNKVAKITEDNLKSMGI